MTLILVPCFEHEPHDGALSPYCPIHGAMSDDALSIFVDTLYQYAKDAEFVGETLASKVEIIANRDLLIIGGQLAAVKGDFVMLPSCCAGLEAWREWEWVKPGGGSPWLGHNPDPGVEVKEDHAILRTDWSASDSKELKITYEEVQSALITAEEDLKAFHKRLSEWLTEQNMAHGERFLSKLDEEFEINLRRDPDDNLFAIVSGSGAD